MQITNSKAEKIILGIDPGTRILGYGLIRVLGNELTVLQYGVLNLSKYPTQAMKFMKIYERLQGIIEEFNPDELAIESPFYGENVQSMLKLGRVQGIVMGIAFSKGLSVAEYEPKKIKQSVTGNGNASKEQLARMVEVVANIRLDTKTFDASDALGIAICHHFHDKNISSTLKGTKKGWSAFVSENPDRIK